jgi:hypothetical protein
MRVFAVSVCACALLGCVTHGPDAPDDGDSEGGEDYVYADELESTQSLATLRSSHAATLLADGRVLLVGGILGAPSQLDLEAFVAEVELFDPTTETFEQGAALASPRSLPSASRLADGRVVVLGGNTLNESTLTVPALEIEVWDPASESFASAGQLPSGGVLFHCAVPLGDQVLVIDECQPGDCAPLRVDPDTGATVLGGDPTYRYGLDVDCAALPDGRVLLAGGIEVVDLLDVPADHVEIYDPTIESFELVGPMSGAHGYQSKLVTLGNGDVLILGAPADGGPLGHIYSPSTGEFTPVDGDVLDRAEHTLTVLGDGRVLIVGGVQAATLELAAGLDIFDPATGGFGSLDPSFEPRKGHTAVRLDGGPVLIAGGQDAVDHRSDAYLFR